MNNLRRSLVVAILLGVLVGAGGGAQAHVLKEDNGISAVLHIPPDDNPVAGEPTKLYLSFGDAANAFGLDTCDCQVTVKNNGRTTQTAAVQPALSGATLSGVATVKFPMIGVYDVLVRGTAAKGQFHAFQLDYLIRVETAVASDSSSARSSSGAAVTLIAIGSLAILGAVAWLNVKRGVRYQAKAKRAARKT